MFRSLKITLLLSHTGIILLTNLLLASVSYFYLINTLENNQKQYLEFITRHTVQTVNSYIKNKADLLERISAGQEVINYSINFREPALASYLAGFHSSFPNLSFINEQGIEKLRVTDGEIAQNVADYSHSSFFSKCLAQPNKILIFPNEPAKQTKEPVLQLAIAKHQYFEDRFAGLLLATLPYRKIAASLADIRFSAAGFLLVNDENGNIITITHPSTHASAEQISISRAKEEKEFPPVFTAKDPKLIPSFLRASVRGIDSFVATTFIPELRWTVMTVLPHEEFMQQVKKLQVSFIILFIIFFALASLLSYILANGITMPLARLSRAARAIAQGNLNEIIAINSRDEIGKLIGSFNIMTRNLQETTISRDYFNTILSSMQECLIVLGQDGKIETINNSTIVMLGYEKHELTGKPLEFILKKDEAMASCPFSNLDEGEILRECELIYLTKWGREIPVHFSASPMKNSKGDIYGIVCLAINISRRKKMEMALRQSEAKLREIAITDELTSLLNRRGFRAMAAKQLQMAKRQEGNVFLMYADVDNLKWVNDHLGHHAGDQVLIEIADLLRATFRDSDTIARLGGDEFAVLLIDPADEKSVINRLEKNLRAKNNLEQRSYELSLSIGVVRYDPEHPSSIEELMNRADNLMYECKQRKKQEMR
ncbi:MAG: diguanylate cyclase [Proteobacteria bacterium]|nr:diguanylate cyclase [Pseudomonadota bacterium]MBU4297018.1 diguanylate cyclase [Pseudomonadota bacterium]MCG2749899.1 diguanylate cyclase [Desulfobulbaceae bacterium]